MEETCEELQRATEAETSLRNRCACLEEKQMQKKGQIEVAFFNIFFNINILCVCVCVTVAVSFPVRHWRLE